MRSFAQLLRICCVAGCSFVGFPALAQVLISEFMASNTRTLADEDGDFPDWIELYNASDKPVNLAGWYLTDDATDLTRWKFPSTNLAGGDFVVVFASNKNRANAGAPLHTNFKLASDGDFLALVKSDGVAIAAQFAPQFPPQLSDISFGFGMTAKTNQLVTASSPVRFHVPTDDRLGDTWTRTDFDDTSWLLGMNGLGFEIDQTNADEDSFSSSVLAAAPLGYWRFEELTGTNAANSGKLGTNAVGVYNGNVVLAQTGPQPTAFAGLEADNRSARFGTSGSFVGTSQSLLNDRAAFTLMAWIKPSNLSASRVGICGQNDAIEFGFIDPANVQIWTPSGGSLTLRYPFPFNAWHHVAAVGDGVSLKIYFDGVLADTSGTPTDNYGQSSFPFNIGGGGVFDATGNWFSGLLDEVALFDRALSAGELVAIYQAALAKNESLAPRIKTDLANRMHGINSAIFLRVPFSIPDVAKVDQLNLQVRYDDGFVAYLNGRECARRNAPATPGWNASATATHPNAQAIVGEEIDISAARDALQAGENVLAIQGLNASATNSDFLIEVEMEAITVSALSAEARYFQKPTPGELNSIGAIELGPIISNIGHSPVAPNDGDDLAVIARVTPASAPIATVTLRYRVMYGPIVAVTMFDDGQHGDGLAGDEVFGASIPASAAAPGQMIRYYITATDAAGRGSRWPLFEDPKNSPEYFGAVVTDPAVASALPVLYWFVQNPGAADNSSGTRCSIFFLGEFYDNVGFNLHGQSSTGFPKKSYDVRLNRGDHLRYAAGAARVADFNLLTTYPDKAHLRNILAYETYRDAGSPYHFAFPVRVQQNGKFFSDAHFVENGDDKFLARVGLDPQGALYKMYNTFDSTSGAEKKTRKNENNADLQALISGVRLSGAARAQFIYDHVNVPAMVNYLAAMIVTGGVDCCHKNYYAYRDSVGTGEWQFLPWDQDLTFGRNWTGSLAYFDDVMYVSNPLFIGDNNTLISALFNTPTIRQMYLRRVRTLMDQLLQVTNTPPAELRYERRIDELAALIAPDAALDFARWPTWGKKQTLAQAVDIMRNQYLPARRKFLYGLATGSNPQIPPVQTNNVVVDFGALDFNPASGNQAEEFIELKNPNAFAVDVSGWKISGAVTHWFTPGTVLPARGSLYLSPNVNAFRARVASPRGGQGLLVQGNYHGQLSARGETLRLIDDREREVSALTYAGQPSRAQQFLRITEIMYHPLPAETGSAFTADDFAYIELKNIGAEPLDLAGVRFTSGIQFAFNAGTLHRLAVGQRVLLVKKTAAFIARYGPHGNMAGEFLGSLQGGDALRLDDASGEKILEFQFQKKWYLSTDGQGFSLVIVDENAPWSTWGDKTSWRPSGEVFLENLEQWKTRYFSAAELTDAGTSGDSADPDGDGQSNEAEFFSGTNPRDAQSHLRLEIVPQANGASSDFKFQFLAAAGRSYSLQYRDSLSAGTWLKWSDVLPRSSDGIVELTASPGPAMTNRFFRVVTPQQP